MNYLFSYEPEDSKRLVTNEARRLVRRLNIDTGYKWHYTISGMFFCGYRIYYNNVYIDRVDEEYIANFKVNNILIAYREHRDVVEAVRYLCAYLTEISEILNKQDYLSKFLDNINNS